MLDIRVSAVYKLMQCRSTDDHDVWDITVDSLRKQLGVVPQDTVLFSDRLMYNLKYANQDATDEQV